MATNSSRLNLTRDQLASFLTDHQQIKQFEMLFSAVDAIAPNVVLEINIAVGTAQATANNAIDQIIALGQDMAVNDAAMSAKVHQAMDAIPRLAQALELLAAAPVAQAQMPLFDDLTPRAELGTMAAQNAEKVAITGGTIAGCNIVAPETHAATSKTTPVDADELPLVDSAASNVLRKLTWVNLKATLATWINGGLIAAWFTAVVSKTFTAKVNTATGYNLVFTTNDLTTGRAQFSLVNTSGQLVAGIEGSTAGASISGSAAYSSFLGSFTATPYYLVQDGTIRATVSSTGMAVVAQISGATVKATSAAGYLSSDGSAGYTGTVTTGSLVGKTITIKDGIITAFA